MAVESSAGDLIQGVTLLGAAVVAVPLFKRLGLEATMTLGATPDEAHEIAQGVRSRDAERLQLELAGGIYAGRKLILGNQAATAKE